MNKPEKKLPVLCNALALSSETKLSTKIFQCIKTFFPKLNCQF